MSALQEGFSPAGSAPLIHVPRKGYPLWRLLSLLAPYSAGVLLSAGLGSFTILSGVGLMAASAYIISAAALHPSIADLQVAIVGVRFFGLARGIFRYLERYVSHRVTLTLVSRLRAWFYQAVEPLAPARLISYHSGDLISRAISDIGSLESFYVRGIAPLLVAGLTTIGMGLYLASFNARLGLVFLVFFLISACGTPLLIRVLSRETGRRLVQVRAEMSAALVDGIQGMPELLVFGQEQRQMDRIEELGREQASLQRRMARLSGLQAALGSLLANLGMGSVLLLSIPLVSAGQMSGVYLAVLALAVLASFEAALPLPVAAQYLETHLAAARRLFELVDAPAEVRQPASPLPVPKEISLEVRNLSFRYPVLQAGQESDLETDQRSVLNDISFALPAGKRLAVVGPSGAGKSTLVNLLLRFWEYQGNEVEGERPARGEILLGGQELCRYDPDTLRSAMAVVSQNTYLFHTTVRENLLLSRPEATEEEIIWAARQAHIHDFIESLPDGYQTRVGEHGLRLSAGERQRLSIARALLKNAPFLILDEATANLDAVTEQQVLSALDTLMEGRTCLVITHRLVGMEAMDEILVLKEGRMIERGRHADLLAAGGFYRRMWDLQNQQRNSAL